MRTPEDFAELIKAATLAAIARTESRSPAAAEHARRNLDDVTQAAALEALERLAAGADGDAAQIVSRAANAVITREFRASARGTVRTAPWESVTADGCTIYTADTERAHAERPTEDNVTAAAMISYIADDMPAEWMKRAAPDILRQAAEGYKGTEIARRTGYHPRKVQRVIKAAREAAQREGRLTA